MTYEVHEFPNEERILKQIREEYDEGYNHVLPKRLAKKDEIKDYVEASEKKVKDRSIYTFMQAYMSVLYTGTHSVRWSGDGGRMSEKAENLNEVAEFDYKEMGMAEKDYQWIWESIFYGVGIQLQDGFDRTTKTPKFRNISALSFIADPYFTDFNISGHRCFGFDMEVTMYEMRQKAWKNIDLVSKKKFKNSDSYRNHIQEYRNLGRTEGSSGVYDIYYHYTKFEGKKYFIVLANDRNTILHNPEVGGSSPPIDTRKNQKTPSWCFYFCLDFDITKILPNAIIFIDMNGVFDGEKPNKRSEAPSRRNIISNIFMNKFLVERKDFINIMFQKQFSRDCHARRCGNRHISVKRKFSQNIIFNSQKNLHNIATNAIHFTISKRRIFHNIFVRHITRICHNKFC